MKAAGGWGPAEVVELRDLTPTVRELVLRFPLAPEPVGVAAGVAAVVPPGSHVKLRVALTAREDERCYSVVDAGADGTITIAVKHLPAGRGGSRFMWSLRPGDVLQASLPGNAFELGRGAPHCLLLAGGIGVTPLVAMARALVQRGASLRMVYAARSKDELAYRSELAALLGERLQLRCGDQGQRIDIEGEIAALPPAAELYVCGPLTMLEAARGAWAAQGRHPSRLRFETFGSSGHHAAQAFTVHLPRLGRDIAVPADVSLLDALNAAGVQVLSECRRGECGLCALDVIASHGEIDHRDVFFSAAQKAGNTRLCTCVSRVAGGSIAVEPAWRGDPDLGQVERLARPA